MRSGTTQTVMVTLLVFSMSLALPNRALAAPSLQLSGGTMVTECLFGNCVTLRKFCVNPPRTDFHLDISGAAADSTVTMVIDEYQNGNPGYWQQLSSTDIGMTDGSGNFEYTDDPPPGYAGAFNVYVIISGEYSNFDTYRNNVSGPACS